MSAIAVNLNTAALGERLGLTVEAIENKRRRGDSLPVHYKIGRQYRYRLQDVEQWEAEQVEKETARRAALAANRKSA